MPSRRHFLQGCAASPALLVLTGQARADDKPEDGKPGPLVTAEAKKAIDAGLKFLQEAQHKDGAFGTLAYKGNAGVAGACGLALLAGGNEPGVGAAGAVLDAALDFVADQEDPRQRGFLHNAKASPHGPMYEHGFATWFLAAAHGHIADKKRAEKVAEVLGRAVTLTLASQNPTRGWRYLPTSKDADLTITAVQLGALRAARDAGVGVPRTALDRAAGFVKRCQARDGGFWYMAAGGGKTTWARTGAGLLALYCAGLTRGREVERALAFLASNRPDPKAARPARPSVEFAFGHALTALATWAAGGDAARDWYTAARDELLPRQRPDGSWLDVIDPHYATAMALIALQAPHGRLSPQF